MTTVAYLIWIVAVIAGSVWIALRPAAPADHWTATRDLALNQQLRSGDVIGPSKRYRLARMPRKDALVGQHLTAPRKRGEPVGKADVAPQPVLSLADPGSGVLIYSLKGEEQLADGVEIASWVVPCFVRPGAKASDGTTTRCAKGAVAVEAVHRATSSGDATWLALRIPRCWTAEIGEYIARDKRFLLVAARPDQSEPTSGRVRSR